MWLESQVERINGLLKIAAKEQQLDAGGEANTWRKDNLA